MIRFIINKGNDVILTNWIHEPVKYGQNAVHTAAEVVTKLRQEYGNEASIKIERNTVIEKPNLEQVRYAIHDGSALYYSAIVPIAEQEGLALTLKEKFPKATLIPEIINGNRPL
jgi:hypothetical protein